MCSAPPESNDSGENRAEASPESSHKPSTLVGSTAGPEKPPSGPENSPASKDKPVSSTNTLSAAFFSIRRKSTLLSSLNNGSPSGTLGRGGAGAGNVPGKMDVINPAFVFSHFHQAEDAQIRARNLMTEINAQIALFRDLLIHMGTSRDCPEMREKIRKLRRACVDTCRTTAQLLLPSLKNSLLGEGPTELPALTSPSTAPCAESPHTAHLVILYFLCQLFIRELSKCSRLVQLIPMDMTGYFENRAGPSNLGNVISQILLCKQIAPDFNQEEVFSISKDTEDLTNILNESQKYLPQQDSNNEKLSALNEDLPSKWTRKRRRSSLYKNVGSLCCLCRPNYL
uniref:Uncharacterized protein n=1 Tax=Cacopsylla melanoneura TaxID=428564 RepID=A0A8D9BG92_9HEMI